MTAPRYIVLLIRSPHRALHLRTHLHIKHHLLDLSANRIHRYPKDPCNVPLDVHNLTNANDATVGYGANDLVRKLCCDSLWPSPSARWIYCCAASRNRVLDIYNLVAANAQPNEHDPRSCTRALWTF